MDAGGLMPWADVEGVGGFRGDDHGGAEGAPNLADLGLQGVGRVGDPPSPHSASIRRSALIGLPRWSASRWDPLLGASHGCERAPSTASDSPKNLTSTPQPYGDRRAGA